MICSCWISTDEGAIWAFVGPMLAIITVSCVMLCISLVPTNYAGIVLSMIGA